MTDYFTLRADQNQMAGLSNLALAYLGDGVYELMVRSYLCLHGKATNKGLHKGALKYVSAPGQALGVKTILPLLSEEESDVFRRGRNANPHSIPQKATREEYQAATALETLFGWLYLQGRRDRLNELFNRMMEETPWP